MRFTLKARQISCISPLQMITRYRMPRERLHADSAFADAIIAKYTAVKGIDLPAANFIYPGMCSEAVDTMDRLSRQLITINRIRVQMNVYNQNWLHQYALFLESSCETLLRQLGIYSGASFGLVSQTSVNELKEVFHELRAAVEDKSREGLLRESGMQTISEDRRELRSGERIELKEEEKILLSREPGNAASTEQDKSKWDQDELVLRILTAASRGNGTRERYMKELYRRLRESGREVHENHLEILNRAGTELFLMKDTGITATQAVNGWASESARQFFWRVQRAPEQERELLLRAGGYSTVVSLERALKSMDSKQFRQFSTGLLERLQHSSEQTDVLETVWMDKQSTYIDQQIEQISPEEWIVLTGLLEKEGYFFTDDGIVSFSEENVPMLVSEQARQLYWRIQQAPEQSSMSGQSAVSVQSAVAADRFGEDVHSSNSDTMDVNFSQARNPDSDGRLRVQKEILLRQLHTDGKTSRVLEKVLRTVMEQRQVLTENTKIFNVLSESVLDMTLGDWQKFQTEIANISESELPDAVHFLFLQTKSTVGTEISGMGTSNTGEADVEESEIGTAETILLNRSATGVRIKEDKKTDAKDPGKDGSERILRDERIRMSREKTELIRKLRNLSDMPDASIYTVERFLQEHTTFHIANPAVQGQHYYQRLTAREKENWHSFVKDVISVSQGAEATSIPSEQVFLRIHSGAAGTMLPLLKENGDYRNTALEAVEKLREERVYTEKLQQGQTAVASEKTSDFNQLSISVLTPSVGSRFLLQPAGAKQIQFSGIREQDMELAQAEMEVPHRAETAKHEVEVARKAESEERSEHVFRDIEFETSSRHVEEHTVREVATGLRDVMSRLDRQQKEIERLGNTQQKLAERNVSREILKQLDERVQMERLRGGR